MLGYALQGACLSVLQERNFLFLQQQFFLRVSVLKSRELVFFGELFYQKFGNLGILTLTPRSG
jgi:hypothetical protein